MKRVIYLILAFTLAAPFSSSSPAQETSDPNAGIALAATNVARTLEDLFFYENVGGVCVADRHSTISFPSSVPREERYFFYDLGVITIEDCGSYVDEVHAVAYLYANSKNVDTSSGTTVVAVGSWSYASGNYRVNKMKATGLYVFPTSNMAPNAYRFPFGAYDVNPYPNNPFTYKLLSDFFTNVLAFGEFCESKGGTYSIATYPRVAQWSSYDYDGGGVPDVDEWLRGTDLTDVFDDYGEVTREDEDGTTQYWCDEHKIWYEVNCPGCNPNGCDCGACCSDKCTCGHWTGDKCDETETDCSCHEEDEAEHTCGVSCIHCCADCDACAKLTVAEHELYHGTCDGSILLTGCPCHGEIEEPAEHKCAGKCVHCCADCDACKELSASEHEIYHDGCDGTDNVQTGCSCHDETEEPKEHTCAGKCVHCCADCAPCAEMTEGRHLSYHGSCDETDGANGCSCHAEKECVCTGKCVHCCTCDAHETDSLHGAMHSTCDGTNGPNGCSCHGGEVDVPYPDVPDFDDPKNSEAKFFDDYLVQRRLDYLLQALERKFSLSKTFDKLSGIETTTAPYWNFDLPMNWGEIEIDFDALSDYAIFETLRFVLATLVWWELFLIIFNSLRKLL